MQFANLHIAVNEFKGSKNQGAFKFIYDQLSKKLYSVCLRYLTHTAEAQDVLQESFITMYQKIDTYAQEGSFEGWARRITVNNCLQKIRSKKEIILFNDDYENYNEMEDEQEGELYNPETVLALFKEMPDNYRIVLSLYVIDGFSHRDIAHQLNIKENASKVMLLRAKKYLKSKFLQHVTVK